MRQRQRVARSNYNLSVGGFASCLGPTLPRDDDGEEEEDDDEQDEDVDPAVIREPDESRPAVRPDRPRSLIDRGHCGRLTPGCRVKP